VLNCSLPFASLYLIGREALISSFEACRFLSNASMES
jgi:hypothetical protein